MCLTRLDVKFFYRKDCNFVIGAPDIDSQVDSLVLILHIKYYNKIFREEAKVVFKSKWIQSVFLDKV